MVAPWFNIASIKWHQEQVKLSNSFRYISNCVNKMSMLVMVESILEGNLHNDDPEYN